jgi:hypothetical protein
MPRDGEPDIRSGHSDIEAEIRKLTALPRKALAERWRAIFEADPPKGVRKRFLIGAVAYEMQARRYGDLKPMLRRRLLNIGEGYSIDGAARGVTSVKLKSGARIFRDWNGLTHMVEVVEDGFIWNGGQYRSLSAIARAITGARWSGPRFFGLRSGNKS